MKAILRRRSISTTLRLLVLASTLVALVVALGAMIGYDLRTTHRGWVADVEAQADLIGLASASALAERDAAVAGLNLTVLRSQPKVRSAAIYDAAGRLFASYLAPGTRVTPPAPLLAGNADDPAAGRDLVVRRPVKLADGTTGIVYLRTVDEFHDRLVSYSIIALVIAVFALAATWLVSTRLQAIVTRPILDIAAIARDVAHRRDYSRRAAKLSDDEVGELVDAFNGLLGEIERRRAEQQRADADKDLEVEERRRAQQEVMRLNEELEERVALRTAQLQASNTELSAAIHEAETANRAKSEFLSNMSHELRTPLNAIIGFGQLMAADDLAPSSERNRGFVKHIVDAGNHLLTLINEILNLAQIESGKISVSLEPVELRDILDECQALTRTASTQRGIRLLFPADTPLQVHADRTRLKQVLLNLLSNAVKYNRDFGAVIVECAPGDEGRVRLSIQDTGPGLTPEQLRSLFQPFNRLGRERTSVEGSGIGLVLTRRLVELMGGTLGVNSTPGSGSTFWVDLRSATPLAPPAPAALAPRLLLDGEPGDAPGRPATILCVDDNRTNLALLSEALALRTDCQVLTATDGQAGVEMARSYRPDVILMDNNMPVLSGRDAMKLLRADPLTAAIPIIAVSAAAMPDAVAGGLELGYFRYLVKPYDLVDLGDALDAALDAARATRRA